MWGYIIVAAYIRREINKDKGLQFVLYIMGLVLSGFIFYIISPVLFWGLLIIFISFTIYMINDTMEFNEGENNVELQKARLLKINELVLSTIVPHIDNMVKIGTWKKTIINSLDLIKIDAFTYQGIMDVIENEIHCTYSVKVTNVKWKNGETEIKKSSYEIDNNWHWQMLSRFEIK